jgi:uncharacterized repeat protein (TIGR01451 family)
MVRVFPNCNRLTVIGSASIKSILSLAVGFVLLASLYAVTGGRAVAATRLVAAESQFVVAPVVYRVSLIPLLRVRAPITDTGSAVQADLAIHKTSNPNPHTPGSPITYTLVVSNSGPYTVTAITLTENLPAAIQEVNYRESSGTFTPTSGAWTGVDLAAGQRITLTISGKVPSTSTVTLTNTVSVTGPNVFDGNTTNNIFTNTNPAAPVADLSLSKGVSSVSPKVGSTVRFTVTVTNIGPSAASGVTVSDTLPGGYTFQSASPSGAYDETTGKWTIGALGKNISASLVITALVKDSGVYTNYAQVATSDQFDLDSTPGNNSTNEDDDASVTLTPIPVADLSLNKSASSLTPKVGSTVRFTVTVTNAGPSAASGVAVSDTLPGGYTFQSASPSGAYDETTGKWTIGALGKNISASLVITALVKDSGVYTNYAQVATSDQFDLDSTPGNNSTNEDDDASVTPNPVPVADLSLNKSASSMTPKVGSTVRFTVTVTNSGPSAASGVTVSDTLSGGYTFQSANPSGAYNETTGKWTIGALSKNISTSLVITALVKASGVYTNYAQVAASGQLDPDSTPGNGPRTPDEDDDASVTPNPVPMADLSLSKAASSVSPKVGSTVRFTVTVTNAGPSAASGVTVSDTVPSGYDFTGTSATIGSYSNGRWTIGALGKNTSASLVITALVKPGGVYTNYAQVAASGQLDPDSMPGNGPRTPDEDDDASVTLTPIPVADLSLSKAASSLSPKVGSTVRFTVTVTNAGPSNASGVLISDPLPLGYSFVAANPPAYNNLTGLWNIGALTAHSTAKLVITATVRVNGPYDNYAQVVLSNEADPNSTPGDNSTSQDDDDIVVVTPQQVANLSLDKAASSLTPKVGSTVIFTVAVHNAGPNNATGVTVKDQLPSGYTFLSATPSVAYNNSTGVWTVGNLAVNTGTTLLISARVNSNGVYTNSAQVQTSDQVDLNSTPGNNSTNEDDDDSVVVNPIPVADLSLDKRVNNTTPPVTTAVRFTIVVTNSGPSNATGVIVKDQLPSGYAFAGASTGSYNSNTGEWTIGNLNADANATLTLTATVNTSGVYTNSAQVQASGQHDPDSTPGNNSTNEDDDDIQVVTPKPVADLSLDKSVDNPTPNVGDNVIFTVLVTNGGPNNATGVTVKDLLPSGYTFQSKSATVGTYDENTGVWTIGNLNVGSGGVLLVTARANASGVYTNSAQVQASDQVDLDSTPGNNSTNEDDDDSVVINPIPVADLSLDKQVNNPTPQVNGQVRFSVVITNNGPSNATGVIVKDQLPSGYGFVGASVGGYNSNTGGWVVGNLTAGAKATLVITATVKPGGDYTNTAQLQASTPNDSAPGNNQDSVTVAPIPLADLALDKQVNNLTPLVNGQVRFSVVITNNGPSSATGVIVKDQLPSGYAFVGASAGSYDSNTGGWAVGNLVAGAKATLVITATVKPSGDYTNVAQLHASTPSDSAPGNNQDSVTVAPIPLADLSLEKQVNNITPLVNEPVRFSVVITNNGPSNATGVIVKDKLPSGYALVGANSGSYDSDTGEWVVGNLAASAKATLVITATVKPSGDYTNIAQLHVSTPGDNAPGNNQDSVTVAPILVADLSLDKQVDNPTPLVNGQVRFSVVITNNGPSDATGVIVKDQLPGGYGFVGASAGSYNSATGEWAVGTLAAGAKATLVITATVKPSGDYTNIAQLQTSTPSDSAPGNNQDSVMVIPIPLADLSLDKQVDKAVAAYGSQVQFSVVVSNAGPSDASGVIVSDLLPSGYQFVGVTTEPQTEYDASSGAWTIGNLSKDAKAMLLITAIVNASGVYTNYAQIVKSDQPDPNSIPGDNNPTEQDDDGSVAVVAGNASVYLPLVSWSFVAPPSPPAPEWRQLGMGNASIDVLASYAQSLYAGEREGSGVYNAAKAGECTLAGFVPNIANLKVRDLTIASNGEALMGTFGDRIYYSANASAASSWQKTGSSTNPYVYAVIFANDTSSAYAGADDGVYKMGSPKNTWSRLNTGDFTVIRMLRFDNGKVWVGSDGKGIGVLASDGNFSRQNEGLAVGAAQRVWDIKIISSGGRYFIATSDGVFTRQGESGAWSPAGLQGRRVLSLEVWKETLYVGLEEGGVWSRPLDLASDWVEVKIGAGWETSFTVRDLLVDASLCDGLYAATQKGVWVLR